MKKNDTLPDFSKLCPPNRTRIWEQISLLIFFFFLTSVCGFLWEVLIFLVKDHAFRNRGFLYGPWLPVYGVGAVLFYCLFTYPNICQSKKSRPLTVFFLTALLGTGLELVIGWLLDTFWHLRYWDYSGHLLNFRGYICLWSALGFGIAGTVWICCLSGLCKKLWFSLSGRLRRNTNTLLLLFFLLDCAAALIFPNTGRGVTFRRGTSALLFFLLSSPQHSP